MIGGRKWRVKSYQTFQVEAGDVTLDWEIVEAIEFQIEDGVAVFYGSAGKATHAFPADKVIIIEITDES